MTKVISEMIPSKEVGESAATFENSDVITAGDVQPSVLSNVRSLIRTKTRFEPEDVQPVSEFEALQNFRINVNHTFDARVVVSDINGYFSRSSRDVECNDVYVVPVEAHRQTSVRLQLAREKLCEAVVSAESAYDAVTDGVYLAHSSKFWNLHRCSPCSGKGRINCHTCYGRKKETCPRCSGGLFITCDNYGCFGGQQNCSQCSGSGRVSRQVATTVWGPNGSSTNYHTEYHSCTAFNCSFGKVQCSRCMGTARINCPQCYATGLITCRTCHGVGDLTCSPCSGSGQVGEAAWVDVHIEPSYRIELSENAPPDAYQILKVEGIHGVASLAARLAYAKSAITDANTISVHYDGEIRIVRLAANCNETLYNIVAYGPDLRWLTLDDIVEELLLSDLRRLNSALTKLADDGLFAADVDGLLQPLQAVTASELNAEVVEGLLSGDTTQLHQLVVSDDYALGIKTGILGSLRHIYTRLAKRAWWKVTLLSAGVMLLGWGSFGMAWGAVASLATLPLSYWLFNRLVSRVLCQALGSKDKAKRAMAIASTAKRDRLAMVLLLMPGAAVTVGLGLVLPTNGIIQKSQAESQSSAKTTSPLPSVVPERQSLTAGQTEKIKAIRSQPVDRALAAHGNKDLEGARKSLQSLANSGDVTAAGPYGYMLVMAEGLRPKAMPKSQKDWDSQYSMAKPMVALGLENGDTWAQAAKGLTLTQAWGEPRDTTRGLLLLKQAAAGGHAGATHALGMIYINGDHVPADPVEARKWFVLGAGLNTAEDIYNLGLMDWSGAGIRAPDKKSALNLWSRAAQLGEPRAKQAIANGHP